MPETFSILVENSANLDFFNQPEIHFCNSHCNSESTPNTVHVSSKPCVKKVNYPPNSAKVENSSSLKTGARISSNMTAGNKFRQNKISANVPKKRWVRMETVSQKTSPNLTNFGPVGKNFCDPEKIIGGAKIDSKFFKKSQKLENNYFQFKDKIPQYLLTSKAIGTLNQYSGSWNRIQAWCYANAVPCMPMGANDFSYFLIFLAESTKSFAACRTSLYACQFMHKINHAKSPLEDKTVHLVMESIKRKFAKAPNRAIPTTRLAIEQLFQAVLGNGDRLELLDLRIILTIAIQFGILGRCAEVRELRVRDFKFKHDHMVIRIGKSKTNQFQAETHYMHIHATGKKSCPVELTKQYLTRLGYTPKDRKAFFLPHIKKVNPKKQTCEPASYIINKRKNLNYNQVAAERKRILNKAGIRNISHKQHGERRGGGL